MDSMCDDDILHLRRYLHTVIDSYFVELSLV